MSSPMQLIRPSLDYLPAYVASLKRGWSPDNVRGAAAALDELAQIEKDPRAPTSAPDTLRESLSQAYGQVGIY